MVNAAFHFKVEQAGTAVGGGGGGGGGGYTVTEARLVYGAIGKPHAVRAVGTEAMLTGVTVSRGSFAAALHQLAAELTILDGEPRAEYAARVWVCV